MFDSFKKWVGQETSVEKQARKEQEQEARERFDAKMQAWQSQFSSDTSVTPHEVATLRGHKNTIFALTVLSDGTLASGSYDHTIMLWNVRDGSCVATLYGHTNQVLALTELSDGRLASGSKDTTIMLWDVKSGSRIATLGRHTGIIYDLTVLADGKLASASHDDTIMLWDVTRGSCVAILRGHRNAVCALTVLADGRLASGSSDKTIMLWDVTRAFCVATLRGHKHGVSALTMLADGRLASGSDDKTIMLWDVTRGLCVATLRGHTSTIWSLTTLPDGRLASGAYDNTIMLWDVTGGSCVATLRGHTKEVCTLTMLADGRLASGAHDKTIMLWDVGLRRRDLNGEEKPARAALPEIKEEGEVARKEVPPAKPPLQEALKDSATLPEQKPMLDPKIIQLKDAEVVDAENLSSKVTYIPEGKVKLEEELGRGGFGTVYKGQYNFQTVAVKRYEGARLPARQEAEILHEVAIMLRLQHECLVRLLGLVQIDSHPAMVVMEYGANGSLYAYLQSKGEIPWGLRLRLAEELARGIAYLHQERIVHRDIKSLNVVLDRDLHAKWCDFGLAVLKLHTTTTTKQEVNSPVGTLRWMAPELFSRKTSSPSTASDIWALGMVFFELASRDVPFKDAQSQAQVQTWIMTGEGEDIPEDCKNQSPAFGTLMQRCWSERNARPSAEEVVNQMIRLNGTLIEKPASALDSGYMDFSRP